MYKIFIYDLDRVLLIFLLLVDLKKDKIIYITSKSNSKIFFKLVGEKINLDDKKINAPFFERISYIKRIRKKLLLRLKNNKKLIYGLDQYPIIRRIFYDEKINLIEEGTINYVNSLRNNWKFYIKKIILKVFGLDEITNVFGYSKNIKTIYLTKNICKEIPKGLRKKAKILDLKELWNGKTEEEKKYILDVFNFNPEILKQVTKNTVMLFTQPLSEDGVISEDRKIELYSQILKKYPKNSIILKPHPREKTDYSKYFNNCYVMKEKYPVEILELVEIKIEKAVTIFSTAVFGLGKDIQIDFYGTEIDENLYKRFGSCDNIMKRNAFL